VKGHKLSYHVQKSKYKAKSFKAFRRKTLACFFKAKAGGQISVFGHTMANI